MNATTSDEIISKSRAATVGASTEGVGRVFTCVGCRSPITDQYILQVSPDLEWHIECLRCHECDQQLDEQNTCFVRDGKTYCKADYLRLFGIKCVGCRLGFAMTDLVMRARHRIYHLDCFRCSVCRRRLVPGDEYALDDDRDPVALYCRQDYDAVSVSTNSPRPPPSSHNQDILRGVDGGPISPNDNSNRGTMTTTTTNDEASDNNNDHKTTTNENGLSSPHPNASTSSNSSCSASGPGGGGVIGGGMLPRSTAVVGKKSGVGGGTGGSRGGGSGRTHHKTSGDHPKTTRVRTVLNEKQLHTLRTCYAANPRPDALMKDQLVEMTGLSSRVIRVWFQNKRCKDKKRTILIKQIQQQHHDKLQGVPLIATSPIQHDPSSSLQATPVEIHQFIHHHPTSSSSWNSIAVVASVTGGGEGPEGTGPREYPTQPPLQISADALEVPGQGQAPSQGQGHSMAFQQLLSSFGDSDDDDTVVSLEETSVLQRPSAPGLHPPLPPVTLGGTQPPAAAAVAAASRVAMQRITRFSNDLHLHPSPTRLSFHHHHHHHQQRHHHHHISPSQHLFNSSSSSGGSSSNFISSPAHLIQQSTLKAFDAKC